MNRRPARLAVLGAGTLALVAAGLCSASAAHADTTDTAGTTTVTVPESVARTESARGVGVVAGGGTTTTYDRTAHTVTFTLKVTGGDADVANFTGSLHHAGSVTFVNLRSHRSTTASDITLNYITNTVDGTLSGSTTPVALFDLDGQGTSTNDGTTQTYTASALDVDPAGAAAVNKALRVAAFTPGQTVGAFATTYTVTRS